MLRVTLKEEKQRLKILHYDVSYPFSMYTNETGKDVYWNLSSIECKNIQNSFRIAYAKKIDFSASVRTKKKIHGGEIYITKQVFSVPNQYILFTKKLLFYVNEKNATSILNGAKKRLPLYLLVNEEVAKQSIQFFIDYDGDVTQLKGEEITFYLNLFDNE